MPSNLYELVRRRAEAHPDAIAFGAQENLGWRTLTGAQVLAQVDVLASELVSVGVSEGDRVVLWMPNHWRTPLYLFACWRIGAVAVPFDRETNPESGARILDSVEPACVIVGYAERPLWIRGREVTPWWEPGSRQDGGSFRAEWSQPAEPLAVIVFTSGTTGNPKGCMISQTNLCSQVEALRYTIPLDVTCRLASILPLSHLFELTVGMLYPFSTGAAIHYIPSRRSSDILRVLSEQQITHMIAVPQLLTLMGHALDEQLRGKLPGPVYPWLSAAAFHVPMPIRRRLFWPVYRKLGGHLRTMASGGAALPAETQLLWEKVGVRVVQGYGASECSPVIACGSGDGSTPLGSVGRPIRGVEVRTAPDGELSVRGPNVMGGYWKDPERSSEVLRDGWYATGDLAALDPAGNITLSGRATDLIVLPSGMNVWPQDVEDALRADPEVEDAAVMPVPTPSGGATLHAYLLAARPASRGVDVAAIVSRSNGRLAQHQRIASASWWNDADFPRTSIGKVRRNLLPLPDTLGSARVDSSLDADDPVGQAISGVTRVVFFEEQQTLAALGLDSFGLVELSLALEEKTGKSLSDGDLSTDMTVGQLRTLVVSAPDADADLGGLQSVGTMSAKQPFWPYTWGRVFRVLSLPFDLLYRLCVTRTVVLGGERLRRLPERVIFAGTHHSFTDLPLIRFGLLQTPARRLAGRLVVAASDIEFAKAGALGNVGRLLFGICPLRQRAGREASLRGLAALAASGNAVLIFPQGHHSSPALERAGDPSVSFRPGVAYLAATLEAAVVPFGIAGTEIMMPPDRDSFQGLVIGAVPVSIKRGPLAIAFGEVHTIEPGESAQDFAGRIQRSSFSLTRQAEEALRT